MLEANIAVLSQTLLVTLQIASCSRANVYLQLDLKKENYSDNQRNAEVDYPSSFQESGKQLAQNYQVK